MNMGWLTVISVFMGKHNFRPVAVAFESVVYVPLVGKMVPLISFTSLDVDTRNQMLSLNFEGFYNLNSPLYPETRVSQSLDSGSRSLQLSLPDIKAKCNIFTVWHCHGNVDSWRAFGVEHHRVQLFKINVVKISLRARKSETSASSVSVHHVLRLCLATT